MLQCVSCIILLQNVSFYCSWIIFSGDNSGKDINFCSNCEISSGDTICRDSLDSSGCVVGTVFCVMQFHMRFSMSGLKKISWISKGV